MGVNSYLQLVFVGIILILAYLAENQTSTLSGNPIQNLRKKLFGTGADKG